MRVGETIRNISLASALAFTPACERPAAQDTTPTPRAAETADLRSEKDRNIDIARDFMDAVFENDKQRILSLLHPELRARYTINSIPTERISVYLPCNEYRVRTTTGYVLTNVKSTRYVEQNEWRHVVFVFDPPCLTEIRGKKTLGWAFYVSLKSTHDGKYAPYNFPEYFADPDIKFR